MSISSAEGTPRGGYWDQYTPTEPPVYRVTDVDVPRWVEEGVTTIIYDVEGTLGETGSEELVYAADVREAREEGAQNIVLETNKEIKSQKDRRLLRSWAEQTEADLVLTPLDPSESKPSPVMDYKIMQHLGVQPAQVGKIGDKVSSELRAGYFAGIEHRAWTRPFGDNRHIGDRLVRDPLEAILRVRAHLLLTPTLQEQLELDANAVAGLADAPLADIIDLFERGQEADGLDNIVGYGLDDIKLSEEILQSIRQPVFRRALQSIKTITDYYGEAPAQRLKDFLYEYGRTTADSLTYARLAIAAGIIAINTSNLDAKTKHRLNIALVALGYATDLVDGPSARRHKNGATKKGGDDDRNIDKVFSLVADIFALIPREVISKLDVELTAGRDIGITLLRRPFKARGIDAGSIWSGKGATDAKAVAQVLGLILGKKLPRTNSVIQHTASGLKIASMAHAPFVWIEQHELKQHTENNRLRQLGATGTASALEA